MNINPANTGTQLAVKAATSFLAGVGAAVIIGAVLGMIGVWQFEVHVVAPGINAPKELPKEREPVIIKEV